MADKKISALTASTTPLAGTEVLPIVQSGATVKVSVANLTAGRAVATAGITNTGNADLGAQVDSITAAGYGTRFSGASVTNNGTDWYGSYGRAIWNSNASTTGGARRFGFFNGLNYTNFGLIQSVDANTDPALGGNAGTVSSGTLIWSMDSTNGNNTLHTGNLVIGTSGKGIDFSATPGTGTSELFADYEEGTWTPGQGDFTVVGTFTSSGTYTKVGRLVTATAVVSGATSIAGNAGQQITGLPFVPARQSAGSCVYVNRGGGGFMQAFTNNSVFSAGTGVSTSGLIITVSYEV